MEFWQILVLSIIGCLTLITIAGMIVGAMEKIAQTKYPVSYNILEKMLQKVTEATDDPDAS